MSISKPKENLPSLSVVTHSGTSPEVIALLENTVFGTKGKIRYRQKRIAERMASQSNIEFIQIKKRDRILGTVGVVTRSSTGLKNQIKSLYVRYLSVNNPFRKKEKKRLEKNNSQRKRVENPLKMRIGEELTTHFENPVIKANEKAAFYAFVESENFNSKELCINLGFNPSRQISTVLFSRFYPESSALVFEVEKKEQKDVEELLYSFYEKHSFYYEDRLFDSGTYLVLKNDGKIIAGLRYHPVNWEIVEVPGFSGFLMQNLLPYLPITNKIFTPKNLNFLAFDYAWTSEDDINFILELMNHSCSVSGINLGMFWGDIDSKLTIDLKKSNKLGFLDRLNGDVTAEVMLRFINMNKEEQSELLNKHIFVSALDMT